MAPIEGHTVTRDNNKTMVECSTNSEQSTFYCNGTSWIGRMPNCSGEDDHREADIGVIKHEGESSSGVELLEEIEFEFNVFSLVGSKQTKSMAMNPPPPHVPHNDEHLEKQAIVDS